MREYAVSVFNDKLLFAELNNDGSSNFKSIDEIYFDELINFQESQPGKIVSILKNAFNDLRFKGKLKEGNISFALPLELFFTYQVPYDNNLLHQELKDEFNFELNLLYPFINDSELNIQFFKVPVNQFITYPSSIIFGIDRKYLKTFLDLAKFFKLTVKKLDNPHISSDRFYYSSNLFNGNLSLSIYLTSNQISFFIYENQKPVLYNSYEFKTGSSLKEYLAIFSSARSLSFDIFDNIYFAGDTNYRTVVPYLEESISRSIDYKNPFEIIDIPEGIDNNLLKNKSFSSTLGLAFK